MKKKYLANAFSLQMIDTACANSLNIIPVSADEVAAADFESVVGHQDTASVFATILKKDVAFNRTSLRLHQGDTLYVGQVTGGRLPEGATTLPENLQLAWLKVEIL